MRRWLIASIAWLVAAGAIFLLLSSSERLPERSPDHAQIDSASRAKLRQVLREERGD